MSVSGRAPTSARREPEPDARPEASAGAEPKQVYLRTVYPLNPGIPHYLDFPRGWR